MKAKVFTALEVAEEVGAENNNEKLTAQLKLFLTTVELCGFKFFKEAD